MPSPWLIHMEISNVDAPLGSVHSSSKYPWYPLTPAGRTNCSPCADISSAMAIRGVAVITPVAHAPAKANVSPTTAHSPLAPSAPFIAPLHRSQSHPQHMTSIGAAGFPIQQGTVCALIGRKTTAQMVHLNRRDIENSQKSVLKIPHMMASQFRVLSPIAFTRQNVATTLRLSEPLSF